MIFEKVHDEYNIVCYWDNKKTGNTNGIPVEKPNSDRAFDILFVATSHAEVDDQLMELGIPSNKINRYYIDHPFEIRNNWLRCYAEFLDDMEIKGSVAEAGVYKGDFAIQINRNFKDSVCYLFDTFQGFMEEDVSVETEKNYSLAEIAQFSDTSEDFVLSRMPNRAKVKAVKGFFPQSALDKEINDLFMFVNLDMDLYQPTIEGLRFFSTRMVKYGVILVHDYFTKYEGIKKAVHNFLSERDDLQAIPVGDEMSIAIVGF